MDTMRSTNILSDDHLKAIGLVTAEWATLEYFLHAAIWALADIENAGRGNAITDHLRAPALAQAFDSLAYDKFGDSKDYEHIRGLSKEIGHLYGERNRYAHAHWEPGNRPWEAARLNRRYQKRLAAGYDQISAEDIENVAQGISDLTRKIVKVLNDNWPAKW